MARAYDGVVGEQARSANLARVEDATRAVGERIGSLAETIRARAPSEGGIRTAATRLADGLEATAGYLRERRLEEVGRDLTGTLRRYPTQAVLVALGLGYLLTRRFR
jgi:hypothetical protein